MGAFLVATANCLGPWNNAINSLEHNEAISVKIELARVELVSIRYYFKAIAVSDAI